MLLLDVPFNEKDKAKSLGAKWNPELKKWYVENADDYYKFDKWMSNYDFQLDRPIVIESFKTKSEENAKKVNERLIEYLYYADKVLSFESTNEEVGKFKNSIDEEIYKIKKGSDGEKELMYQLVENSYRPMYILPDVTLSNDKDGQCDFIVITRYNIYVIECKNWNCKYLNVNKKGEFRICYKKGDKYESKNIVSPYQRNKNHTKLLNQILNKKDDLNLNFEDIIKSVLVFTNKEINFNINNDLVDSETTYADVLPFYMETLDKNSLNQPMTDSQMQQIVDTISQCSVENDYNYLKSFEDKFEKIKTYYDELIKPHYIEKTDKVSDCEISIENRNEFINKFSKIKTSVYKKIAFKTIMTLLLILASFIYLLFFIKNQTPKFMADSPTKDLWEMTKIIFMLFYPLGVVSGINGLIIGFCKEDEPHISVFGCILQASITTLTVGWLIKIDTPESIFVLIFTIIILTLICAIWNIPTLIFSKIGIEISGSIYIEKLEFKPRKKRS